MSRQVVIDYDDDKKCRRGIYGEWELIKEYCNDRANDGSILSKYKCKICNNIIFVTKHRMDKSRHVCKICTENYYKYNFIGKTYNRLTIIKYAYTDKDSNHYYYCKCSCNNLMLETPIRLSHLKDEDIQSCGCIRLEKIKEKLTTHGLSNTRLYSIYDAMIRRCYDINNPNYYRYGKRGIYVCNEWLEDDGLNNFYNWAIENGYRDDLTIDRMDNDEIYAPWNCRWATKIEQANNRSSCTSINIMGTNYTKTEISRKYSINKYILNKHINNGERIEDLVNAICKLKIPISINTKQKVISFYK